MSKPNNLERIPVLRLPTLRKIRGITQEQLAKALGVTKSAVCQTESRNDIGLATLKKYVLATGGKLEIKAVYPDGDWKIAP